MKKPHKHAWHGLDAESSLSVESLSNMAQRAALESTGDIERGRHRVVFVSATDRSLEFRINDFQASFNKLLVFSLAFTTQGARTFLSTTIDWYTTAPAKKGLRRTKEIVAHHTFMEFVHNLASQIQRGDATARVSIRQDGATHHRSKPPAPSAPTAESFPPAAPDTRTAPPQQVSASPNPPPPPPPGPVLRPREPGPTPESSGLITGIPGSPSSAQPPPVAAQGIPDRGDFTPSQMAQSTTRAWRLVLVDGSTLSLTTSVIVGRDPVAPASHPAALAVRLTDPTKTVSKTHALFESREGTLLVTDLNSGNGTTVTNTAGETVSCPPGSAIPVGEGWRVAVGGVVITAQLEGP